MEGVPLVKRDEQCPLLKVEGGGGDGVKCPQNPTTVVTTSWRVPCLPKRTFCSRWPEYVSACWMTLTLMAITFLVFYVLGISVYRQRPLVLVRCNESKASNVYYHHIVPRGDVPFEMFSGYLSYMATQYPLLHFHVYFLLDDSWPNQFKGTKHSKLFSSLVPQISRTFTTIMNPNHLRDIREFQRKYQNFNISVMYLSKYMASTPLKYKWKTLPTSYLPFYARVYETWKNGGVGLDLTMFNNQFYLKKRTDRRISAILQQHNDGIDSKKYAEVLNSFDKEEDNEFFSMFLNLFHNIINEPPSILLNTEYTTVGKMLDNSPVIRTHRTKRESKNEETIHANFTSNSTDKFNSNSTTVVNITSIPTHEKLINNGTVRTSNNIQANKTWTVNNMTEIVKLNTSEESNKIMAAKKGDVNDLPRVLLFYDLSAYMDDRVPVLPKKNYKSENDINVLKTFGQSNVNSNFVTISPDGSFLAVTSRYHPFLFQLSSAGCLRHSPTLAIKDLLWRQCSGYLMNDSYCSTIRLLYL